MFSIYILIPHTEPAQSEFEDVVFIEGLKNYAKIHTAGTAFLTMTSMKELESFLPEEHFMRIHKSYIVAVDKIARLSRSKVCFTEQITEQKCLPVGDTFRGRLGDFVSEHLI